MAKAEPEPVSEPAPEEAQFDPFARHRAFAKSVRAGNLRSSLEWFLDTRREPIDVRADKILDLASFGKGPKLFLRTPRPKRPDEFPAGYEDRLKKDLERQFILRNLMRFVKTVNRDDPLEFEKKEVGLKLELDARSHLRDLHRSAELVDQLGVDHVKGELAWRHRMLEIMQWERYFCREIKEDFQGPIWKHDPDTNPIQSKALDEAHAKERAQAGEGAKGES